MLDVDEGVGDAVDAAGQFYGSAAACGDSVDGFLDGCGGVFGTGGVCAVVDGVDAHGRIGHEGLNSFDGYRVRC